MTDAAVTEILTCLGDVFSLGDLISRSDGRDYLALSTWSSLGRTQDGYNFHISEYWFEVRLLCLSTNRKTHLQIQLRRAEQVQETLKDWKVVSRA